jgi:hypothetical protein
MISLRAGIDNLLDKQPVLTAVSNGFPQGTDLKGLCTGLVTGCTAPTSYSLPNAALGTTNTGFYDVMGRRFFIAAKLNF